MGLKKCIKGILPYLRFKRIPIDESWKNKPSEFAEKSDAEFLSWFDTTNSVEEALEKAKSDWHLRFRNFNYFEDINKGISLEIGCGGGRLLYAASQDFEKVIGVDIHSSFDRVSKILTENKVSNFSLINAEETDKIPSNSIDFIYSFIVFQHFPDISVVHNYLDLIERVLSPNGVAHIYYGKSNKPGIHATSPYAFKVRDCSLFIHPDDMKRIVEEKFIIIDKENSLYKDPVNKTGESGQARICFRKKV